MSAVGAHTARAAVAVLMLAVASPAAASFPGRNGAIVYGWTGDSAYNEVDLSDKPWFISRWNNPITAKRDAAIVKRNHERKESLQAVDEGVERPSTRLNERATRQHLHHLHVPTTGSCRASTASRSAR